jgi:pentatricopeptide repeat protein
MGAYHPYVAQALNTLADIYNEREDFSRAESLAKRALVIRCKTFSVNHNHPDIAESFNTLVSIYFRQGKYDLARQLMNRVLGILEVAFDAQHPDIEGHVRAYIPMLRQMNYTDVAEAFEARIKQVGRLF